jgi:hypothetical protein
VPGTDDPSKPLAVDVHSVAAAGGVAQTREPFPGRALLVCEDMQEYDSADTDGSDR